jgi:hypothetical protein
MLPLLIISYGFYFFVLICEIYFSIAFIKGIKMCLQKEKVTEYKHPVTLFYEVECKNPRRKI